MATPTVTMTPTRPTETRRRRRTPSMSSSCSSDSANSRTPMPRGEAHYRDVLLLLQSEFSRVVTALETRATSLEQHNDALQSEVATLREELTATKASQQQQQETHEAAMRLASEQQQMLREESASRAAVAAENERKWVEECERLRVQLQNEQKQWELERETRASELARVNKKLQEATARLAGEQQTNATMSQELQLLQCRVDTAVATSRSFEARLQQLKQLKRDEKADFEAHVAHLKRRLDDKKQQNQYLTEALMDKETRKAARSKEPLQLKDAHAKKPSSRRVARDHEELQSHAPTSPTSSASPLLSPTASSLFTISQQATTASTTVSASAPQPRESSQTSRTRGSDRLQRELDGLRRKISACMATETNMATRP